MTKIFTSTRLFVLTGSLLTLLLLSSIGWYGATHPAPPPATPAPHMPDTGTPPVNTSTNTVDAAHSPVSLQAFTPPLSRAAERVTKKPFGIRISPTNSPINPEKFTGIHTGTDFEAFTEEVDLDVPVYTICAGPLLRKQQARGYGGMAVQACTLEGNPITVVYGHIKLASVAAQVNEQLEQGTILGVLGKGYSPETDGERKHLHLSVHKGASVVTNGYIPSQTNLDNWLDVMHYIQ